MNYILNESYLVKFITTYRTHIFLKLLANLFPMSHID